MNDHSASAPAEVQAAGTVGGVLTDLAEIVGRLPLPAGEVAEVARILDRLAEELAEGAAMLRALPGQPRPAAGYTFAARAALSTAVDREPDFAGWLAGVLAGVAARRGSVAALTAGRPGSWEAGLLDQLAAGTAGYEGEDLDAYRE